MRCTTIRVYSKHASTWRPYFPSLSEKQNNIISLLLTEDVDDDYVLDMLLIHQMYLATDSEDDLTIPLAIYICNLNVNELG